MQTQASRASLVDNSSGATAGFALPFTYDRVGVLVAIGDAIIIFALGLLSGISYHLVTTDSPGAVGEISSMAAAVAVLFVLGVQSQHMYATSRILNSGQQIRGVLVVWALTFLSLSALAFLFKISVQFSRGTVMLFAMSGAVILPLVRIRARAMIRSTIARGALAGRKVVILGEPDSLNGGNIAARLRRYGYVVLHQIMVRDISGRTSSDSGAAAAASAAFAELAAYTRNHPVEEIILAFAPDRQRLIDEMNVALRSLPLPVRLLPDRKLSSLISKPVIDIGAAHVIQLQVGPLTTGQQLAKRALDIVLSAIGLVMLAPLFLIVAAAIRLESAGPALFRQRRAGFNGRTFKIYKFRTMTSLDDGAVVQQAVRGDKRVTAIGAWLRKTSVDELPQLINVLKGEMSLVGPRPHALAHDNEYDAIIATYALRHHMKPGITGWAQVSGYRGETPTLDLMEKRVQHDLWYIANWSFWIDLKVIAMTILQVIRPKNVY